MYRPHLQPHPPPTTELLGKADQIRNPSLVDGDRSEIRNIISINQFFIIIKGLFDHKCEIGVEEC